MGREIRGSYLELSDRCFQPPLANETPGAAHPQTHSQSYAYKDPCTCSVLGRQHSLLGGMVIRRDCVSLTKDARGATKTYHTVSLTTSTRTTPFATAAIEQSHKYPQVPAIDRLAVRLAESQTAYCALAAP